MRQRFSLFSESVTEVAYIVTDTVSPFGKLLINISLFYICLVNGLVIVLSLQDHVTKREQLL